MDHINRLRRDIAAREAELADLKSQLALAESQARAQGLETDWKWPLEPYEYERYSRQMIVPGVGLQGQLRLRQAKVLIVGAGGLGCPAAAYLAGAGVGTLGLVDGDVVETSNLHRQTAHASSRVGMPKVESAITYLNELNPTISYRAHGEALTPQNAQSIVSEYDFVLDCTDRPASRYLVSDICVLLSKPLVSASAFQTSGQLIVLNSPPGTGPCYRCVFPKPPPPETVVGCGEGGILGPVVGVMGVLQALQAVKVIMGNASRADVTETAEKTAMLLLSGAADPMFRTVRMRGRRKDCFACGDKASLSLGVMESSMDYVQFCGIERCKKILPPQDRISALDFAKIVRESKEYLLLDVREKEHFDLCSIPGSVNVPIGRLMSHRGNEPPAWMPTPAKADTPIYVVCRLGNDSQLAAKKLRDIGYGRPNGCTIKDIQGGVKAWKDAVDPTMPLP